MKRSAFIGLLALGFVVLAGTRPAHSLLASPFKPVPIQDPPVQDPPWVEPRPRDMIEGATVHGKIKLRPTGVDMSWCSALKVTARVQSITLAADCGGGIACVLKEVVIDEHTTEALATPAIADRSVWQYELVVGTYDETRVELSARCDPAYDYRYRAKGAGSKKFAIQAGEALKQNLRLRLSVPETETRTVVLEPSIMEDTWASRCQPAVLNFSCDPYVPFDHSRIEVGFRSWGDSDFFGKNQIVYQTLLWFDLSEIQSVPRKHVLNAELRYRENVTNHKNVEEPVTAPLSCVGGLGNATQDWTSGFSGLVPNDEISSSRGPWTVTRNVSDWLADPESNYGYVIKSADESFNRRPAYVCESEILDPELVVTYLAIADVPVRF